MEPSTEFTGWFTGTPKSRGRYYVIESAFWLDRMADWMPGEGNRPGRWYIDGLPPCEASGVAYFRPRPALPTRTPPKERDDARQIVKD